MINTAKSDIAKFTVDSAAAAPLHQSRGGPSSLYLLRATRAIVTLDILTLFAGDMHTSFWLNYLFATFFMKEIIIHI